MLKIVISLAITFYYIYLFFKGTNYPMGARQPFCPQWGIQGFVKPLFSPGRQGEKTSLKDSLVCDREPCYSDIQSSLSD